ADTIVSIISPFKIFNFYSQSKIDCTHILPWPLPMDIFEEIISQFSHLSFKHCLKFTKITGLCQVCS
ncbi:hypothetical protein, partial [Ignavigranum ruoffiae]|uniref:hypothetical protein n=1 Tax=Ignavigranum ruoffiae TaxID=89093 RepID=UPI0024AD0A62